MYVCMYVVCVGVDDRMVNRPCQCLQTTLVLISRVVPWALGLDSDVHRLSTS